MIQGLIITELSFPGIKKKIKDALEWLNAGIRMSKKDVSELERIYKIARKSKIGKNIFPTIYDVDFFKD